MKLFDSAREIDLPSPPLAERAWERARAKTVLRRRRRVVVAAALAVASAAVAITVLGDASADQRPSVTPPAVAVVAPECPTGSDPTKLPLVEPADLAMGAVSVSLCPTQGANWQAPEPLTSGIDELVTQINARPATVPSSRGLSCLGDHRIDDYTMTFTYPDARTATVWGQPCANQLLAGTSDSWTGAIAVWQHYLAALEDQRADLAPASPHPPSCPEFDADSPESLLRVGPDLDLVNATVCTFVWTKVDKAAFSFVLSDSHALNANQVARLNSGFAAGARQVDPDYDVGDDVQSVVGKTAWGDNVQLEYLNGELVSFASPAYPDEENIGWHLSPNDQDALSLADN